MMVVNVLHTTYKWLMISFICVFYHIKKEKSGVTPGWEAEEKL